MAYVMRDANGKLWALTDSINGESVWTPATSGPTPPTSQSTITIQNIVDFAATQTELMPLMNVGGYFQEPALSLANDVIQELLGGFPWRCNRAELPLMVTQQGR